MAGVVATSRWTRGWLVAAYGLDPGRVLSPSPAWTPRRSHPARADGSALLCVGAVTTLKGYDVLAAALGPSATSSGPAGGGCDVDRAGPRRAGLGDAVRLTGPMTRAELDATYAEADLLVLASRAETYGMVVTEALAHGVPVIVSDVGGVREALGGTPGVLVPPGDPDALAGALRRWLTDAGHRAEQRAAARVRRTTLPGGTARSRRSPRALEARR